VNPPPDRIETERLLLRRFEPEDVAAFAEMLEDSREHYAEFIPFFVEGDPAERVERYVTNFEAGEGFVYAAFEGDRMVGGGMLFPRVGPAGLELGYQLRRDAVGRGLATEIAAALLDAAFTVCEVDRVEAHIDPENRASIAVAERLGMPHEATLRRRLHDEGREPRDLAIYTLFRSDYVGRQVAERG
jgi:RimJ/RimL family protein N-acetyltransferase